MAYCKFYKTKCIREKCPAYEFERPMSNNEKMVCWVKGIDYDRKHPYVKHWCIKYLKLV